MKQAGYYCIHCERCIRQGDERVVRMRGDEFRECPFKGCDGGHFDLFRIAGDFTTGEYLEMGTEKFDELRRVGMELQDREMYGDQA